MSGRHRGRRRPFAATRPYFPQRCNCHIRHTVSRWVSIFDLHVARTVAPR